MSVSVYLKSYDDGSEVVIIRDEISMFPVDVSDLDGVITALEMARKICRARQLSAENVAEKILLLAMST